MFDQHAYHDRPKFIIFHAKPLTLGKPVKEAYTNEDDVKIYGDRCWYLIQGNGEHVVSSEIYDGEDVVFGPCSYSQAKKQRLRLDSRVASASIKLSGI